MTTPAPPKKRRSTPRPNTTPEQLRGLKAPPGQQLEPLAPGEVAQPVQIRAASHEVMRQIKALTAKQRGDILARALTEK